MPLVRGLIAIVFGIVLFAFPISAVAALVILFGAYAFVDGVLVIVQAFRFAHPDTGRWWWLLAQGIAGILIGVITFFYPGITAGTLAILIAFWAIITGGFEIGAAIRLRRDVPGEIFLIVSGVLSIVLGALLFLFPLAALLTVVWLLAAYSIIAGVALIALALRLRGMNSGKVAGA
jgi:uncharacterized membrane protein HdeD (DUF308 family)